MRNFFSLTFFTLSFLFTWANPHAGPGVVAFFEGSFEQMKSQAYQEQKPYMLSFHDDGIPSRNLKRFTYSNPQLANYVANNYLIKELSLDKLDELTETLVDRYQVILFPTIVLFSSEGKLLYRFTGFTGDQAFIKMLEAYRYKKETDMSMAFPPETFSTENIREPEALIFQDLNNTQEIISDQSESEVFDITELNDLNDETIITDRMSDETFLISEEYVAEESRISARKTEEIVPELVIIPEVAEPMIQPAEPVLPQSLLVIQTGVYSKETNALKEQNRLGQQYSVEVQVDLIQVKGQALYRVRIGPFDADGQATNFLNRYNKAEKLNAIIKTIDN